jgi:hypothetical protein
MSNATQKSDALYALSWLISAISSVRNPLFIRSLASAANAQIGRNLPITHASQHHYRTSDSTLRSGVVSGLNEHETGALSEPIAVTAQLS